VFEPVLEHAKPRIERAVTRVRSEIRRVIEILLGMSAPCAGESGAEAIGFPGLLRADENCH
jgi:hypothetical protein